MAGTGYSAWLTVSAAEILISILASAGFWSAHLESLLTNLELLLRKTVSAAILEFC